MFFEHIDLAPRKGARLKCPPLIDTGWRPPTEFPNLENAVAIGFDTETKEWDWDHGPGWARGKSHIVGFSVSALARNGERGSWYFPLRHEVNPEHNCDVNNCLSWADSVLNTPVDKVGANLLFDVGTLNCAGVRIAGRLHDVQFAEALLDETGRTALDVLAHKYLGHGKVTDGLYDWCRQAYGGGLDQRRNIYRAPPMLAGPYAEGDAVQPIDIMLAQQPLLAADGLSDLFRMECDLIPLLVGMRRQGVRVDLDKAELIYRELGVELEQYREKLRHLTGITIGSVVAAAEVATVFEAAGIPYLRTADGKPSFKKEWLKELADAGVEVAFIINEMREIEKLRGTFLKAYILEGHINGHIYCQFHPLRDDDGGAKTGRFSSSDPNLQNIPSRSDRGKRVREVFVPLDGHVKWEKNDHSQVEYRMHAHYAVGPGAEEMREKYRRDPKTDFHDMVFRDFCAARGLDYANMSSEEKKTRRRPLKNINFGLMFGQTEPSLAYKAGMNESEARKFFADYHAASPHIKATMEANSEEVQAIGYITTILGRRTRFNQWEPHQRVKGEARRPALPYAAALAAYGSNIVRAFAYRATNYRYQGSGTGDVIKLGMLACYNAGVFDVIGFPLMQVHDELNFSVIDESPRITEAHNEMRRLLETAPAPYLRVPLRVDHARGPNWSVAD